MFDANVYILLIIIVIIMPSCLVQYNDSKSWDKFKEIAEKKGISLNDAISQLILAETKNSVILHE